jgi:CheY-like chemotaxis protein
MGERARRRVLVVEDHDLLVALLTRLLSGLGIDIAGLVVGAAEAADLAAREPLDAALIGARLSEGAVAVAATLRRRGIPFAIITGRAADQIPRTLRDCPRLIKPFRPADLTNVLEGLLKRG